MKNTEYISMLEINEGEELQSVKSEFCGTFKIMELAVLPLIIFATLMSGLGVSLLLGTLI